MKREQILAAAENLFVEKGFEGTSIRELAQAADVNIAMISYYFGSKEKLMEELVEQRAGYSLLKLEELNKQKDLKALEKLEHIIDFFVDKIFSNKRYHMMIHRELTLAQRGYLHKSILKILARNWEEFRKLIEEGQQKGEFRQQIDVDLVITTVFGLINQCIRKEMMEEIDVKQNCPDEEKFKTRIKNYLNNLLGNYLTIKI